MDEKAPDTISISSTTFTPSTTTPSTPTDAHSIDRQLFSAPWPGSRYIIQHVATSKVVTFYQGGIHLRRLDTHASNRWDCVSNKGWLGFQDPASNMYLGHDGKRDAALACFAQRMRGWEFFCVRKRPRGDYVILMVNGFGGEWELSPVGWDGERVRKMEDVNDENAGWRFIEVPIEEDE